MACRIVSAQPARTQAGGGNEASRRGAGPLEGSSPEARQEVVPVVEAEDALVAATVNSVVEPAGSGGVESDFRRLG